MLKNLDLFTLKTTGVSMLSSEIWEVWHYWGRGKNQLKLVQEKDPRNGTTLKPSSDFSTEVLKQWDGEREVLSNELLLE